MRGDGESMIAAAHAPAVCSLGGFGTAGGGEGVKEGKGGMGWWSPVRVCVCLCLNVSVCVRMRVCLSSTTLVPVFFVRFRSFGVTILSCGYPRATVHKQRLCRAGGS